MSPMGPTHTSNFACADLNSVRLILLSSFSSVGESFPVLEVLSEREEEETEFFELY